MSVYSESIGSESLILSWIRGLLNKIKLDDPMIVYWSLSNLFLPSLGMKP